VTGDVTSSPLHRRVSLRAKARRADKSSVRVHVFELWPEGCKAEFFDCTELHEQLSIEFDNLEEIGASVRWIAATKAGLKFIEPLHPRIINVLLARGGDLTAH